MVTIPANSTCVASGAQDGIVFASATGNSNLFGQDIMEYTVGLGFGEINHNNGNLVDKWSLVRQSTTVGNSNFEFKYGTNPYLYDNPTIASLSIDGVFNTEELKTNTLTPIFTVSGITIRDLSGNEFVHFDTDFKTVNINDINSNQNFKPIYSHSATFVGTNNVSTSGLSVITTTTGNGFQFVTIDSKITANAQSRYVVNIIDNNNVILDFDVDWSGGFSYTYTNASYIGVDGTTSEIKGFYLMENGLNLWSMYAWHDENGEFINWWSDNAQRDIIVLNDTGRLGINMPTVYSVTTPAPDMLSVYPQSWDAVYYYDGISYTDNTIVARSTENGTFIFLTGTTDYTYVGKNDISSSILLFSANFLTGTTLKFEFWNGVSWITMTALLHDLVDNTNGLSEPGGVEFNKYKLRNDNWSTNIVNDTELYWIRISATVISEPSYMVVVSTSAINRFAVYCAQGDSIPFFQVDEFGRTTLGDSITNTRLDVGTQNNLRSSLSIIDQNATMRIWEYSTINNTNHPRIELIKGDDDTMSNNIWYEMRLEDLDPIYGEEGFIFADKKTNHDKFIRGNSGSTNDDVFVLWSYFTGNTTKNGLLIDLHELENHGTSNIFNYLNISNSTSITGLTQIGINICSGLTYGINSQSFVRVTTLTPNSLVATDSNSVLITSTGLTLNGDTLLVNNLSVTNNLSATTFYSTGATIPNLNVVDGLIVTGNITGNMFYGNLDWSFIQSTPTTISGYGITDAYTKTQNNANFLSANTSYYTQAQSNANFLSANTFIPTDFYSKAQSNANFLSANTSYYTQAQSNANFLSANTSFYTQSQSNANFLSANTSQSNYQSSVATLSGTSNISNWLYDGICWKYINKTK